MSSDTWIVRSGWFRCKASRGDRSPSLWYRDCDKLVKVLELIGGYGANAMARNQERGPNSDLKNVGKKDHANG
jgi:hypothetical protein